MDTKLGDNPKCKQIRQTNSSHKTAQYQGSAQVEEERSKLAGFDGPKNKYPAGTNWKAE